MCHANTARETGWKQREKLFQFPFSPDTQCSDHEQEADSYEPCKGVAAHGVFVRLLHNGLLDILYALQCLKSRSRCLSPDSLSAERHS